MQIKPLHTSIAGSCRYLIELNGKAGYAGTTPMSMRKGASTAAAEFILYVENRCSSGPTLVGTVGQLQVLNGSVNVIPGICRLSLDIRAADNATRDHAISDVINALDEICGRRQITYSCDRILEVPATECSRDLNQRLEHAIRNEGLPIARLLSGAGHDSLVMAGITDMTMLSIRCGNNGISHNALELLTAEDAEMGWNILVSFLRGQGNTSGREKLG